MTNYILIIEGTGGELERREVRVGDDPELAEAVRDFISEIGSLRGGDVIRIVEVE